MQSDDDNTNPVRGEMALWNAVIMQMVLDLKGSDEYIRNAARRWLNDTNDFDVVCYCAGQKPEVIRNKIQVVIKKQKILHSPKSKTGLK